MFDTLTKSRQPIADSPDTRAEMQCTAWTFTGRRTSLKCYDNFKNEIGIEVEWNNKTEFFDRDLNNFRLLKDLRVLSVGVIITRVSELQEEFNRLDKGSSYGASTTHWNKLIPKVDGGGAGGCPLLLVGIGFDCYDPNK